MNKTTRHYSTKKSLVLAAEQAGIKSSELQNVDLKIDENGLYIIRFCDDWMSYYCYIDIFAGDILGFYSEPL